MEQKITQDLSRLALLPLWAGIITMLIKALAYSLTGSAGLFSDMVESFFNIVSSLTTWGSLKIAAMPPDEDHAFGHTKVEYITTWILGFAIIVTAIFILSQTMTKIHAPNMIAHAEQGISLSALTMIINFVLGFYLIRQGTLHRALSLKSEGYHLWTDSLTTLAVIIGLIGYKYFDLPWLDPLAGILVGLHIIFVGAKLIITAVHGMMDKVLPEELQNKLQSLLKDYADPLIHVRDVKTRQSGQKAFLYLTMSVPKNWTAPQIKDCIGKLKEQVKRASPLPLQIFVEIAWHEEQT